MNGIVKMQDGLFRLCRNQITEEKQFGQEKNLTPDAKITNQIFEEFRLYKLKKTLQYVYDKSKFYRELFDRHNILPEDIQSIQDLKKIPLTSSQDLAARGYDFLCLSQGAMEKAVTFTSSGTVGPQKKIFFTAGDLEKMTDFMGVGMNTVTGADGVVQILLPSGPVMGQADLLAQGVRKMGAEAVYTGMFVPSEEQIQAIIKYGSTVIFGETRLIYRITKEMEDKYDLAKLGVKTLFVTTSHLSDVMRQNLETAWNCQIVTHYGLTEMGLGLAVDCPYGEGYHTNELDVIAELVDPKTGEVLPDGKEGELVFTTITRDGMPLIRYRTHDIATLTSQTCPCGSHLNTISRINRRLESIVQISPEFSIYPALFDDVLFKLPEVVDYEIYLEKKDGKQNLIFEVELTAESENVKKEIIRQLQNNEIIMKYFDLPVIKTVPPGALKGGAHFKKMIRVLP